MSCIKKVLFNNVLTWLLRTVIKGWSWWSTDQIASSAWWRKKLAIFLFCIINKVFASRENETKCLACIRTWNIIIIFQKISSIIAVSFCNSLENTKNISGTSSKGPRFDASVTEGLCLVNYGNTSCGVFKRKYKIRKMFE